MKRVSLTAIMLAFAIIAGAGRSVAQSSGDLLQFLPDGNAVIIVDAQKVIASSTWASLTSQDRLKSTIDGVLKDVSELGVKLADIKTAALVFPASGWSNPTVAVNGTFNQEDLTARLRSSSQLKLTSEKYKDYDLHSITRAQAGSGSTNISFVFYGAGTVVAGNAASVRASIDAKTGAKPALAQNEKLSSGLAENPSAAIRFAMEKLPGVTDRASSGQLPLPDFSSIRLIFGTVDLATGINVNATLRNGTSEQAKNLADRLNGVLAIGQAYLKGSSDPKMAALGDALTTVTVTGSEADAKITGTLPAEALTLIFR
ncbi:MAG TPA: hypothetical protein VNO14_07680 [Blastocatellia bacterium]|nr:hypothetical protein [Blastocatellia bacterium]